MIEQLLKDKDRNYEILTSALNSVSVWLIGKKEIDISKPHIRIWYDKKCVQLKKNVKNNYKTGMALNWS